MERMEATGDERVVRRVEEEREGTTVGAIRRTCRQKQAQVFALRTPGA